MPTPFSYLSPEDGFLEAERLGGDIPDTASAVVIPFPLEASVSYGGGTARGPKAILAASEQLELFDAELWREAYRDYGVATLAPPRLPKSLSAALDQLAETIEQVLAAGRFPLVLGGEHGLTAGAIRPFAARHSDLVVLQIDAHADLRDGYLGEHFSHAAAMRRVLDHDGISVISVGIRTLSREEADYFEANRDRVSIMWAKDQDNWDLDVLTRQLARRPIYVTFDIDGLDAGIMPATGTPTPGGLSYWRALSVVRCAADAGTIVGGDVVELAPIDGLHACDYTAAAVAYKILNYALSGTSPRDN